VSERFEFEVNGEEVAVEAAEDETLLDVLRDHLGLLAAKDGCQPEGYCGACTVIVDGHARVSCSQPASKFSGKSIVSLEGLSDHEREAFALAFSATGASQCGFCSPGIVVKAMAGNLCRCTGYVKVIDAIELAAGILGGDEQPHLDWSGRIGSRTPKYQSFELALGLKPFINDIEVEGALHGALRFSDHPRAVVTKIDTSKAEALDGVVRVVLAGDVAGEREVGCIHNDWPAFVAEGETTRYVGDVLAGVAASSRRVARLAADAIEITYDVLDPVTDPERALESDAPQVHEREPAQDLDDQAWGLGRRVGLVGSCRNRNVPDAVHRARLSRTRVRACP